MTVKCALCGLEFEPAECPASCPLRSHCKMAHCPNCGYALPTQSSLVNLFQKMFRREKNRGREADRRAP